MYRLKLRHYIFLSVIFLCRLLFGKDEESYFIDSGFYGQNVNQAYLPKGQDKQNSNGFYSQISQLNNANSPFPFSHDISCYDIFRAAYVKRSRNLKYLKECGVSYDDLYGGNGVKGLYQCRSFKKVKDCILENKNFAENQALAIWKGYCEKRHVGCDKKIVYEYEIINEYYRRRKVAQEKEKAKQKELQKSKEILAKEKEKSYGLSRDIQALKQQYVLKETELSRYVCNDNLQCRKEALKDTINNNFIKHEKAYFLSSKTAGYLNSQGIILDDYKTCCGTSLQQQFHKEICQILEKVANNSNSLQFPLDIINFADAACEQNKLEQIPVTSTLADIAWTLSAIPLGLFDSAKDFVTLPFNLPEIACNLGKVLYFVVQSSIIFPSNRNSFKSENISFVNQEEFLKNFEKHLNVNSDLIKQGFFQCIDMIAKSSWHDRIKGVVHFTADFFIPGKIVKAIGFLCSLRDAQLIKNFSKASEIIEGAEIAESFESVNAVELATEEGFKQQVLLEFMETNNLGAKQISKCIIFGLSKNEVLEHQSELLKKIYKVAKSSLQEVEALAEEFREIKTCLKGDMQTVLFDVKHAFIPKIAIRTNYNKLTKVETVKEFQLVGWHHGNLEEFEKVGLFKVVYSAEKQGCKYIECLWDYSKRPIKKTLFPDHWSKRKVIEKIKEALGNIESIEDRRGDYYGLGKIVTGITNEGIKIEVVLKRKTLNDCWTIASAYVKKEFIIGS